MKTCRKKLHIYSKELKQCPECKKAYDKAYRKENKARIKSYREENKNNIEAYNKAYGKAYREENKEKMKAYGKAYRKENKEKIKVYREESKDRIKAYGKAYYQENKDKIKAYYQENKDKIKAYSKAYGKANYQKNKGIRNALTAKRKATKLKATPSWLTKEQYRKIKEIYSTCPKGYHVDHIIPLKNGNVCGLHVPWNLQHLPANENLSKSNKF